MGCREAEGELTIHKPAAVAGDACGGDAQVQLGEVLHNLRERKEEHAQDGVKARAGRRPGKGAPLAPGCRPPNSRRTAPALA
jgi:hypothetical protein